MIANIQAVLLSSSEKVWPTLLDRDAFLYVTRGMISFKGAKSWPKVFYAGQVIETEFLFFGFIPGWKHRMRIVRIDHENMELASEERGGCIQRWNHRKWVKNETEGHCVYTDEIDIDAGFMTFFIWVYAHVFYRYRQWRMKHLIKLL